jgi:DNA-binding response OmpR family regulator
MQLCRTDPFVLRPVRPSFVLFIDDDQGGRQMAVLNLAQAGYEVDEADSGSVGLQRFDPNKHDLVITDVRMPGMSGIDIFRNFGDGVSFRVCVNLLR